MDRQLAEKFYNLLESFRKTVINNTLNEFSKSEFFMLHLIEICSKELKTVTTADLSEKLSISKPAVSQMLNVLEEKGYIERQIYKEDRRLMNISLTEKGNIKLYYIKDKFLSNISNILDDMGREDSERLIDLLGKYFKVASRLK